MTVQIISKMKLCGYLSFRALNIMLRIMVGGMNEIQGHWSLGQSILAVLEIR